VDDEMAARSLADVIKLLSKTVKERPSVQVLLRVSGTTPFQRLWDVTEALQAAGISSIRLAPMGEKP
jgi:biopolymer transport protein ExbD